MDKHFWVAAYDIADSRRLRRVAQIMTRYGARVQKSVFDCWLNSAELAALRRELDAVMVAGKDQLRLYRVCSRCRDQASQICGTEFIALDSFYIV